MASLSETRKADRLKMARMVLDLCRELDISNSFEVEGSNPIARRRITIGMAGPRGLRVSIDFDGESCQPDVYVLAWNISHKSDARLSNRFGNINQFHFQKLTEVAYGIDGALDALRRGFTMAKDGTAFDLEREAACIAKEGTAAEQQARFDQWQAELAASRP